MQIVGCDLHTRYQQIALLETKSAGASGFAAPPLKPQPRTQTPIALPNQPATDNPNSSQQPCSNQHQAGRLRHREIGRYDVPVLYDAGAARWPAVIKAAIQEIVVAGA